MNSSEFKQLSEQMCRIERAVNKLTSTMLPTEALPTPIEQVIADAAGMTTEQKRQHFKSHFAKKGRQQQ